MGKTTIHLDDYRPPDWRMHTVELEFDLDVRETIVIARLHLSRDAAQQRTELRLDGIGIDLLALSLDGRVLDASEYRLEENVLILPSARDQAVVETRSRIRPSDNSAMQGLYLSGGAESGFLLSQCEAEGFRHITWSIDRPDVLARYTVTLRADRQRFPVLLAGGNVDGQGLLQDGRHWVRFVDPQPKPSYLFAIVAGQLAVLEDEHVSAEGRRVQLKIWAAEAVIDRCQHAMECLKAAMTWDERTFGRNYQLDVFHVVATDDFTMGAMENTGLNIFNSKYLLADPLHATDDDYRHVLAVVAHEYFHNWTGNRVTCRDWFQLCLKEGLTVYREQEFVADMASRTLRRIEDVRTLWRTQFSEDAGPLAHAVRPAEYTEINNFYTATIYEKGAEIVRMLATSLGREGFRRGMDLYFERHDGEAVTVEDFLAALGDANAQDLAGWLNWYTQAGTPTLQSRTSHELNSGCLELTLSQHTAPTPGQPDKQPLPIPVALALFSRQGRRLPIVLDPQHEGDDEAVLLLDAQQATFRLHKLDDAPIVSLLRGYSAPVRLATTDDWLSLGVLVAHEDDGFNRWQAADELARQVFAAALGESGSADAGLAAWCGCLRDAFADPLLDPATLAEMLSLADETTLCESLLGFDPDHVHSTRNRLERAMAQSLEAPLLDRYKSLEAALSAGMDAASQAQRRLRNRCLALLGRTHERYQENARRHYAQALCLSDKLAALTCLVHAGHAEEHAELEDFAQFYQDSATVMDKWFAVQATIPHPAALERVEALTRHAAFRWDNPNKVNALLLSFATRNPIAFHRVDGAGYRFIADAIVRLDQGMPQVAARLTTSFSICTRIEVRRQQLMRDELRRLCALRPMSDDVSDIVLRNLGEGAEHVRESPQA